MNMHNIYLVIDCALIAQALADKADGTRQMQEGSTTQGRIYYRQMRQGLSGADMVMSEIPSPDAEPAMSEAMPGQAIFSYFMDDDLSGSLFSEGALTPLWVNTCYHDHCRSVITKLAANRSTCETGQYRLARCVIYTFGKPMISLQSNFGNLLTESEV